jgi:DNA-binding MarR family transcriptional regulator
LTLDEPLNLDDEEKVFQSQPRFSIVYLLFLKRKVGFLELKQLLGLTPGNLDHHIRKLEEVGIVKSRRIISWRPLVVIEITPHGNSIFRKYIVKLRSLLENIPDAMLQKDSESSTNTNSNRHQVQ